MASPPQGRSNGSEPALAAVPPGIPPHPEFRKDLEILPRAAEGAFLVSDPRTGASLELGEREFFIFGQLDGHTAPTEVRARFRERFDRTLDPEDLEAFLRWIRTRGLLVPDGITIVPEKIAPPAGYTICPPARFDVDRFFGAITERLSWCFTPAFAFVASATVLLAAILMAKHWRSYFTELHFHLRDNVPLLMGLGAFLFMNFFQRFWAAVACKYRGGRIRWFGLRLQWYFFPIFQCDLTDAAVMRTPRDRYRMIYAGFVAQVLLASLAFIAWYGASSQTGLHDLLLIVSAVLILFLPWNPLGPRNAYWMLSQWLEVPELRSRSLNATWSWIFRTPSTEPLTRKQKWGFRAYGLAAFLFYGLVLGFLGYKILRLVVGHIDVTGAALLLVIAAFSLEFTFRKELMRFEPFYAWLAKNNGRSTIAWTLRIGLIVLLVLVMFLPYPYEPGGALRILPEKQMGIRTQVQGKIEEVMVKEGDWVEKGEIIMRLDSRRTRKDLEVTEAELRRTEAQLALAKAGSKPEEVAKARESMATAKQDLYYSTRDAERLATLHEEKVVSEGLYEQALQRRDLSKGVYDTSRENLNVVMSGARTEAVETQEAEVERLEAQLKYLREDLALSEIRSPIAGRIVKSPRLDMRVGMEVIVGDSIASVQDDRTLLAEVEVPEKNVGDIKPGARVKVKTWSYPDKTFEGQVKAVAPVVTDKEKEGTVEYLRTEREDAISRAATSDEGRVVRVLVNLANEDGLLKSEMTGYGKVFTKYEPFGLVMTHGIVRFFTVEVWSWIP
ncbi:MAG: HlyD family efflux transporter periplasmic adaptor subunit [Deltaproteobacteria bacterium]|nr:HlyD family efflux transporter periplasmic adaptor subunit [Deltaproteobacteria bacterium]